MSIGFLILILFILFELLSDGTWKHLKGSFNAHNYFIENSNTLRYKKSWK